ncbi:MAG: FtsW/RodA/SpoVE family cell cycle protein, partial [Planctomycetota bacterium]
MALSELMSVPQAAPLAPAARERGAPRPAAAFTSDTSPLEMRRSARALLVITVLLMGLGQVMVFSATASRLSYLGGGPNLHPLLRQALKVALALLAMIVTMRLDYRQLERHALALLIAGLVLLALVLVPGVGARINAAR